MSSPVVAQGGTTQPTSPGSPRRHRRALLALLGAAVAFGFVYFVVPEIVGLGPTLQRLRRGDSSWLAVGVLVEIVSYLGEVVLLHGVFLRSSKPLSWRNSRQITLAGTMATKLLATAGAGGVALYVWALRASGLGKEEVATGMVTYEILNYSVYMVAMVVFGFGLYLGLLPGRAPAGITLVPAVFATAVILIVLWMRVADAPVERFLGRLAGRSTGWRQRIWRRAATVPHALHGGLEASIASVRRRDPTMLGVLAAWGFDIAALWASFRAFGHSPSVAVLVMSYYVGTLANTLPLPGGIGGVEGGMIGCLLAFGVNGPLAVLAVLAYRTISYWLPTLPGAVAYLRLRTTVSSWEAEQPADRADTPHRASR